MRLSEKNHGIPGKRIINRSGIYRWFTHYLVVACWLSIISFPCIAEGFSASFKNTDIGEFINTVSKNLNKTVIIDPAVKGTISVRSYEELDEEQYYQFFLSVLDVYGFAVVDMSNGILKIIPSKNAKGSVIPLIDGSSPAIGDEIVIRVVPLHNVTAKELAPLLRQLNDAAVGSVVHYDPSNVLLITGRAAVVKQLMAIIESVDLAGNHSVETIKLEHASAAEVVRMINSLHKDSSKTSATDRMSAVLVADERTNSVLISGEENARQRVSDIIIQLDDGEQLQSNTQVVYLKYAKAVDMVDILAGVSSELEGSTTGGVVTPAVSMLKNVVIKADEHTNALIINAAPDLMRDLIQVIEQLDIRRAQVLVEAIIVEVEDADGMNLGVQWFNQRGGGTNFPDSGASAASLKPGGFADALKGVSGLAAGFYRGNWSGLFTALQTNSENDILATPSIVTLDNMEAEFNVGQEVPILTGSQTTSGDNVFNTVSRKSVGIKLKVKPQINKGGSVMLQIEQEVSSVAEKAASSTLGETFNTRTVNNAVRVQSGETVVVGGLLDRSNSDVTSKVPILGSLPGIGHLFRYNSQKTVKRNLMLFIRPTIIQEQDDYNASSGRQLDKFYQEQNKNDSNQRLKNELQGELAINNKSQVLNDIQSDITAFYQHK
ncbi:type II secretion system secretin GspD [Yersinia enterocolitica]|uniref:type II secretion system secretin GspD n=1 Tax=Yersinia enterocolitica TaxID=630 RepID=UPI001C8DAFAD|nr:type II secretion system secretin GspD [Yersinia enterocolitica]EKN4180483.1 type II secretion system secretin GspD [Yersinia enterocolitica]MBX9487366.1 type II secretion system secretin GspD [Yersinia enterocolitica]MBX9490722.1 type II secretion system secretin GspD [Yersinia enterocolitica]HEN3447310.1 type II secretion system secretin GspD [Yersinia enterocolitica]